jgi:WD40 repeat protein
MITDFGLARRFNSDAHLTRSGAIVGTPAYMAPEQAGAKKDLTTAVDVHGLGAILYECLTGHPPFQAETPLDTLLHVLDREPQQPRSLNRLVDHDLETVCLKCLEKDPARRYGSAEALTDDLERWLDGRPIQARPCSIWTRAVKWARRKPMAVTAAALVVILLFGLTTGSLWVYQERQARAVQEMLFRERQTSQETLFQERQAEVEVLSLIEQARSERLTGKRWLSLKLLGQAADKKHSPELRHQAIQSATATGVRLHHELPLGDADQLEFSPDGTLLAAAGGVAIKEANSLTMRRGLRVWDVASGRVVNEVYCEGPFAFNPAGDLIALHPTSDTVCLWEPRSGKQRARFRCAGTYRFSPDGTRLAIGQSPGVHVWNLATRKEERVFARGDLIGFLSNDDLLLREDQRIKRWRLVGGEETFATPAGTFALAVSAYGAMAALREIGPEGPAHSIVLWDLRTGKQRAVLSEVGGPLRYARLSADGRLLAYQDPLDRTMIRVRDVTTGGCKRGLPGLGPSADTFKAGFMHLGQKGHWGWQARPEYGTSAWTMPSGSFSPNGSLLAAEVGNHIVKLWDVEAGAVVATLLENERPIWSPNGRFLATAGRGMVNFTTEQRNGMTWTQSAGPTDTAIVRIWEVAAPTPAYVLPAAIGALAFSADGRQLAANGTLWDVVREQGYSRLRESTRKTPGHFVAFGADRQVWAADFHRLEVTLKVWQLTPKTREIRGLPASEYVQKRCLAVSPAGDLLAFNRASKEPLPGGGGTIREGLEVWSLPPSAILPIVSVVDRAGKSDCSPRAEPARRR